jgi:gluconolactonase
MQGEVVAEGLGFPEGPVWHEGSVYFVDITRGSISRYTPGRGVEPVALTGGGPNGATVGPKQVLYITQNGGMLGETRVPAGIQALAPSGEVTPVVSEIAGRPLERPNDLAFGPDGRLYFTDPRGAPEPGQNSKSGRIFVWDPAAQTGELLLELSAVFPNGIGFDRAGNLLWSESFTRRVMVLREGRPEPVVELPEKHYPDGFCVGGDGLLYVASTYAHCVTVLERGQIVDKLMCGNGMPTNCCFAGTDLYVTESRHGALWRFPIGNPGLALHAGAVVKPTGA